MDMLRFDDRVNLTLAMFCGLVAVIVFVVIIRSFIVSRPVAGNGDRRMDRRTLVEIVWAIVPMLILVATAAPAVKVLVAAAVTPREYAAGVASMSHSPSTLRQGR